MKRQSSKPKKVGKRGAKPHFLFGTGCTNPPISGKKKSSLISTPDRFGGDSLIRQASLSSVSPEEDAADRRISELDSMERYLRDARHRVLSSEEIAQLSRRIKRGDKKARWKFIEHNLLLVVSVAKYYTNHGELLDLIQEGNIGLMKAVKKFEPERGNQFATYAVWWIRQTILQALAKKGRLIRLPTHAVDKLSSLNRISTYLGNKLGREATFAEIAKECGRDEMYVAKLFQVAATPESLDRELTVDRGGARVPTGASFHESIMDPNGLAPDQLLEAKDELAELTKQVNRALSRLALMTEIKKKVKDMFLTRWGFNNGAYKITLEEAAKSFGCTRELVRQAQAKCLKRLTWFGLHKGGPAAWEQMIDRIHELEEIVGESVSFSTQKAP